MRRGKMLINGEECRKISSFERYCISESGRIYRTESDFDLKTEDIKIDSLLVRELKVHFRMYKNVLRQGFASLTDTKGNLHSVAVAPLVGIAFGLLTENLNNKKQTIGYKDGNKKNLHYTNLFVTKREYSNYKLTQRDVKSIKKHIRLGIALRKIAWIFGVSEMQINRIKTGENWGNGKRKIKAPVAPFEIKDGRMRKYIATFNQEKITSGIKKRFTIKRNPESPTDNLIVGIINDYKLSLKHSNITRAAQIVENLNNYFFDNITVK
jgi:hypothetical protein